MNIRFLRLGALVIASLGLVSNATAGGYVGASFGQGSVDFCSDARAIGATSCDDSDTGFKLFGGYDFTDNLGVELSYNNLGTVGAGALGLNIDVDASAIAVAARARMAVGDKFGIFGKPSRDSVARLQTTTVWIDGAEIRYRHSLRHPQH